MKEFNGSEGMQPADVAKAMSAEVRLDGQARWTIVNGVAMVANPGQPDGVVYMRWADDVASAPEDLEEANGFARDELTGATITDVIVALNRAATETRAPAGAQLAGVIAYVNPATATNQTVARRDALTRWEQDHRAKNDP